MQSEWQVKETVMPAEADSTSAGVHKDLSLNSNHMTLRQVTLTHFFPL